MRKILAVVLVAFSLAGCARLQQANDLYKFASETTVPAATVISVANAFDILKAGATNYAQYCISNNMTPSICSADIRRKVVKAVRGGTNARNTLEASVKTGAPASSTIYNLLVEAVGSLQMTPAATTQFAGG